MLWATALLLHSLISANRDGIAITQFQKQVEKMTEQKTGRWVKQLCSCASISIFGIQTFVRGAKPPAAPRGDVIGPINTLMHLAPLVPWVSSGYLPSWSSSVLVWPFWGRLAGLPHHLKRLALVICYSWDYAGHLTTGYKWLPFRWSSSILGVQLNTPHDHTHQLWHGRPPVPCTGSHTRWCDTSKNWLPFQPT